MEKEYNLLTAKQKEEVLRDIWIAHDGRWFLKIAEKPGYDIATQLKLDYSLK